MSAELSTPSKGALTNMFTTGFTSDCSNAGSNGNIFCKTNPSPPSTPPLPVYNPRMTTELETDKPIDQVNYVGGVGSLDDSNVDGGYALNAASSSKGPIQNYRSVGYTNPTHSSPLHKAPDEVNRVQNALQHVDWRSVFDSNSDGILQKATTAMIEHLQRGQGRARSSMPRKTLRKPVKKSGTKRKRPSAKRGRPTTNKKKKSTTTKRSKTRK